MMNDSLITTALLGTSRMKELPAAPDVLLEKTWQNICVKDPASAVLQALALTRALHRCGTRLRVVDEKILACGPENHQHLPATTIDHFLRMVRGEYPEVLSEWLGIAAASDYVLPSRVLPELLLLGTKDHSLRPMVRKLAGVRGLWIAERHANLSWIFEGEKWDEQSWLDGSSSERLAWLRHKRASDPEQAMTALISQWSGEKVAMRESILRLISENPLPSDEAWLENVALRENREEHRELASIALARLPSEFRQRAISRIRSCIKIERRMLKRILVVEPPNVFDASWAADGIKEKPPQGLGEKAWWLRQIVSLVPLAVFPELLGCEPGELFALPMERDWQEPLWHGWIDSARRFPGHALQEHFFAFAAELNPWPAASVHRVVLLSALLDARPVTERFHWLDSVIGKLPADLAIELLIRNREACYSEVGNTTLSVIDAALLAKPQGLNRQQARILALYIPHDLISMRLALLAAQPELSPIAEEFATTLEFRRSMIHHLLTP